MTEAPPPSTTRSELPIAGALALACLGLYLLTLCPTVFWYDSAEYVAASALLGIPHPPGYPLYTLIGHLFTRLPLEPAYAVNLMSAVFGALAVALAHLTGRALGAGRLPAAIGALTLGVGHLHWSQSLIAEVYSPALCFLFATLLLLLRGVERGRAWPLLLGAGVAGLGLGVHLFIATCGLGFATLVLGVGLPIERPRELAWILSRRSLARRLGIAAGCLGTALLGACIFLYLPLRAAMKPALNFGDPSSWERFAWMVTGGNYKGWWLSDFAWLARARAIGGVLYEQLLVVGLVLAALGLARLASRRPLAGLALGLAALGNLAFFFRYRVHDVEVFFLPTVAVLCLLVGLGVQAVGEALAHRLAGGRRWLAPAATLALALLPVSLAAANYRAVDLSAYTAARDYGERLCRELPRGAIILNFTTPPEWKNDAVFTHYFQKVRGQRRDVRVLSRPSPPRVRRWLERGVPVYLFFPVSEVVQLFLVRGEGAAYRVVAPRR